MSDSVEYVPSVNLDTAQQSSTTINFVVNKSASEKAPKFTGLIALQGVMSGLSSAVAVFMKDGVPSGAVPSIYGNASLRVTAVAEEFHGRIFYADDPEGQAKLEAIDAAVRVAWYAWKKTGRPQPFSLQS